jgi:LysW-gamma-L-lysine carboxypeptidase
METETARCETLIGLVAHYSPSGQEHEAAAWLTERMRSLGYNRAFIDEAGNAVGVLGDGPHQIVLLGHIDTVPGELPVHVSEGMLYGRGAVDAKGPLAAFTDGAARLGAVPGWQIVVIGAVNEEADSSGAHYAVSQYAPEFAVIGEPNRWQRIALGYKGTAHAQVTFTRPQAHSASGGETACEAAFALWQTVLAYKAAFNQDQPRVFDQILPNLQSMQSGQDEFQQWAELNIGVRLPPSLNPAQWYEQLEALAAGAKVSRLGDALPAWTCEKNSRLVRAFLGSIRAQGGTPAFVYKTGTADLNIVAPAWGCPALVYGPGDSALDHTPDEQLPLADYLQSVAVIHGAIEKVTRDSI